MENAERNPSLQCPPVLRAVYESSVFALRFNRPGQLFSAHRYRLTGSLTYIVHRRYSDYTPKSSQQKISCSEVVGLLQPPDQSQAVTSACIAIQSITAQLHIARRACCDSTGQFLFRGGKVDVVEF